MDAIANPPLHSIKVTRYRIDVDLNHFAEIVVKSLYSSNFREIPCD
jgi:hypothetical protein